MAFFLLSVLTNKQSPKLAGRTGCVDLRAWVVSSCALEKIPPVRGIIAEDSSGRMRYDGIYCERAGQVVGSKLLRAGETVVARKGQP